MTENDKQMPNFANFRTMGQYIETQINRKTNNQYTLTQLRRLIRDGRIKLVPDEDLPRAFKGKKLIDVSVTGSMYKIMAVRKKRKTPDEW